VRAQIKTATTAGHEKLNEKVKHMILKRGTTEPTYTVRQKNNVDNVTDTYNVHVTVISQMK